MKRFLGTLALAMVGGAILFAGAGREVEQSDLDDFMAQVLARRDENWKKLQQYLLDERERLTVHGPGGVPLWGDERTATWFIKEGFFIKSPLSANGVTISDSDRRKHEDAFLARVRNRERRDRDKTAAGRDGSSPDAPSGDGAPAEASDAPRDLGGLIAQTRQPQFIDNAYFLRFKFEQGTYALAGRETFEGQEVLRIEYYPTRLFSHEQDSADKRRREGKSDRDEDVEATMERLMNKVSLVTLWVTPASRQIVKYTFDNVNFDFLPAAWLVRVNDIKATMTMGQPFKDVWLPHDVDMHFSAMLAIGVVDFRYRVDYLNYREATASGRLVPSTGR